MIEDLDPKKPIYLKVDASLKARMIHQCKRLGVGQAAIMKMALNKFLEEEERIEYNNKPR